MHVRQLYSPDFSNTESLGMQLVVTLVEQLEGVIELNRDEGTEFRTVSSFRFLRYFTEKTLFRLI